MIKKNFLFVCFSAAVALVSCTEKMTVDTTGSGEVLFDTTYIASVETPKNRKVLVEEATGVKCVNCPDGTKELVKAEEAHPGMVIVLGQHSGKTADPIVGKSTDTFYMNELLDLFKVFNNGGEPDKPTAMFDRTEIAGAYYNSRNIWLNNVNNRILVPSPLNLSVTSTYNTESNDFIITVTGAYTTSISKKQMLSIMITQDSIIDPQYDKGETIDKYLHKNVMRDVVTDLMGNPILSEFTTIEAGRVFKKSFKYKIPEGKPKWIVEHLNVIAFVHNNDGTDRAVQQAEKIKLKP